MRTMRNRWLDMLSVVGMLAIAAGMMYALLPQLTQPGQQIVPALPESASNPTIAFLTIFIVMTMVGAPVTLAIGLALAARWVSKQVPSSSTAAEAKPAAKVPTSTSGPIKQSAAPDAPKAPQVLSPNEETFWKIAAALLSLIFIGGLTAMFWNDIVRLFNP